MKEIIKSDTLPLKENKTHGSDTFPCAYYWADSHNYAPDEPFYCKHHWHEETEILYFKKGTFQVEINMEKYTISEECFCFIGSGELHYIYSPGGFQEQAIVFSPGMLCFADSDSVQQSYIQPLCSSELAMPRFIPRGHSCFSIIASLYSGIIDCFWKEAADDSLCSCRQRICTSLPGQLQIKANLLSILAALADQGLLTTDSPGPDPRVEVIKKSLSYMKEHYTEKVYIADLARQSSMNEQYYCRFFKKMIGKPPIEYLNELRIKQTLRLLRDTNESVMNISLECGFNNLGNYMRTFKKYMGCTPLQYRKRVQTSAHI